MRTEATMNVLNFSMISPSSLGPRAKGFITMVFVRVTKKIIVSGKVNRGYFKIRFKNYRIDRVLICFELQDAQTNLQSSRVID